MSTAAPARKPLTDEQILEVLQLSNQKPSGLIVRIVRAIERAHGITGAEKRTQLTPERPKEPA